MKLTRLLSVPLLATALLFSAEGIYSRPFVATQKKTSQKPIRFVYVCPMHPDKKWDKPGKCPKCKMTLEKRRDEPPAATPDQ